MEFHWLVVFTSAFIGFTVGQEAFFWKVGQGFEFGKEVSGWGNRNQWLKQVRGSKRPPTLKELEKWWNLPKATGNSNSLHPNSGGDDEPHPEPEIDQNINSDDFNNDGFTAPNWNFRNQEKEMPPTKDPFPPFTKDAALRIRDYGALLKHANPDGNTLFPHRGKPATWNRPRHHTRGKHFRANKAKEFNPVKTCWHPMAYECESGKNSIVSQQQNPDYQNQNQFSGHEENNAVDNRVPIDWVPMGHYSRTPENWNAVNVRGRFSHLNNPGNWQNEDWRHWNPNGGNRYNNYRKPGNNHLAHSGQNYFRHSNKFSHWRDNRHYPAAWKSNVGIVAHANNYDNNNNNWVPIKSTWLAPVYSWNQPIKEMRLMTRERVQHYNPHFRFNRYNNIQQHNPVKSYSASQQGPSNLHSPVAFWNSPSSDQWMNNWSNDIKNIIHRARNGGF